MGSTSEVGKTSAVFETQFSVGRAIVSFLLAITFGSLVGCSGKSLWMGSVGSGTKTIGQADTSPSSGSSVELARRPLLDPATNPDADYGIEIIEREATSELELALPAGSSKPLLTALDAPPRIVLDLEGLRGPKASVIETPESLYVSRIRVGAHPDKSRIVLDMNDGQEVVPSLQQQPNGNYVLTLARAEGASAAPSNQTESLSSDKISQTAKSIDFDAQGNPQVDYSDRFGSVPASPNSTSEKEIYALNEKTLESSDLKPTAHNDLDQNASPQFSVPSNLEEKVEEKMASPKLEDVAKPNRGSEKPSISSYTIQALSPTENTLVIEGSSLSRNSLKRTAPSEYVLRLPGASLLDSAQETLVAPPGSGAIRSVRPKNSGDTLELRIFTTPEESLELRGSKNNLVVAAASGFNLDAARAQAKPGDVAASNTDGVGESVDSEINALLGEQPKYSGRLISLDLQDTDIDNALRIIAEVSNLNIIASDEVTGKITLRLIDVPWDQALDVILKTNGLDKVQEGNVIRIAPVEKLRTERESLKQARQAEEELEPLGVRYVRISYAKASELKALVEAVLSERGSVAYDERTNQLIIKDIRKGILNVAELIAKLDLRTPQVLLETQIVEATRSLQRQLGSELGFNFVQSPATGNATGYNFPNSVSIGGSGTNGNASSFPGPADSAITLLLESADGTRSLSARLSALEEEGYVKIVSRPAVATTNNKQAIIKSVEKIRVKQPSGGLSVATGQGATASGAGTATETIEIGIILEVTPQASPDYYVLLDINAKSSTLGTQIVDGIPSEIERSATSSVLVSSGQTFAMGGIYKTTDENIVNGVPYLKDIPVIGHLFRFMRDNNKDEELLFFITPRIIEGSFDDAAMKAT